MRGRAQSRSRQRSPNSTPVPSAKSLGMTMKLPMITNGHDEQNFSVWPSAAKVPPTAAVGVCSQQGKRPYQEDEYSIRPNLIKQDAPETHFFGLFDGHAGGKCSHYVANNLANTLMEDEFFSSNLPQAIKRSFYTCNEQFLKIAEKMKLHDGSTGLVSLIRDNKLLVANAGDCRALLLNNGRPIQMSTDHKPTSPDEQKRIAALGGTIVYCMGVARVNRVLAVSRAFGNRTLKSVIRPEAELMQRDLVDGDDFLVMASDGLWDVLKNKDVSDVCYSPFLQRKPQAIADELVNLALARGSMDNVTCLVVSLSEFRNRNQEDHSGQFNKSMATSDQSHENLNFNQFANRSIISMSGDASEDNETMDFVGLQNSLPANTVSSVGNKKLGKNSSNNNMGHDGIPKQYSLGNFVNEISVADSVDNGGNNVASMILNKKSNGSSQGRMPFIKAGSMGSISPIDPSFAPSFPVVSNGTMNSAGEKLFTSPDGIINRQATSKRQNNTNNTALSEASQSFKNSLPNNLRTAVGSTRIGSSAAYRGNNNNNNADHAAPVTRASLNDLANIINEFNGNGNF